MTKRSPFNQSDSIQNLVQAAQEKQEASQRDGRGKPGHAGKLGADKRGQFKMTLYLDISTQEKLREMAQEEDCALSDIAAAAIIAFYNAWPEIDLSGHKEPAKSLKVGWKVAVPENFRL